MAGAVGRFEIHELLRTWLSADRLHELKKPPVKKLVAFYMLMLLKPINVTQSFAEKKWS
jgi:hypothetical protein